MARAFHKGFTLIELMLVVVVSAIVVISVGSGLMRLLTIDELNREKARALEKMCDLEARTQTLVAVAAKASSSSMTRMDVVYPYMVFGIVCETNYLVQVTNTTIEVSRSNALRTTIRSGKRGGGKDKVVEMPFMDPLIATSQTVLSRRPEAGPLVTNSVVTLSYSYRIGVKGLVEDVGFAVPVRMRNTAYEGYPDYE